MITSLGPLTCNPKDPLGLVKRDYKFFLAANFGSKLKNKHEFFFLFVRGKTTFLCRDKYFILTYRRLTGFVVSFACLEFLDIRLSLDPSFFLIFLVFRYIIISMSRFY